MYSALWRHLPGRWPLKTCAVRAAGGGRRGAAVHRGLPVGGAAAAVHRRHRGQTRAAIVRPARRILVVDNYDSFVFNLVQYLAQLGAEPVVRRNDEVGRRGRARLRRRPALPGSGHARGGRRLRRRWCRLRGAARCRSSASASATRRSRSRTAAVVGRAPELLHGKTSLVEHDGAGVLAGPARPVHRDPLPLARRRVGDACPAELEVTGRTASRRHHGAAAPRRSLSRACSSTRSPSSPRAATCCSPTGWPSAATPAPYARSAGLAPVVHRAS